MTNKTITLDLSLVQMAVDLLHDLRSGSAVERKLRAALADPVPPAGVDVESPIPTPVCRRWTIGAYNGEAQAHTCEGFEFESISEDEDAIFVLASDYDLAVDRLKAEVERLKAEHRTGNQALRSNFARHSLYLKIAEQLLGDPSYERSGGDWEYEHPVHDGIVALQSELTKALELLAELRGAYGDGGPMGTKIDTLLANQSAPADKGQESAFKEAGDKIYSSTDPRKYWECVEAGRPGKWEEKSFRLVADNGQTCCGSCPEGCVIQAADKGHGVPVAWAMKPGLDRISVNPKASHAVFGHSGEPGWDVPLYAEPPAPVAVVMPERANAISGSYDYQSGYNTCIEDVARLNGIQS